MLSKPTFRCPQKGHEALTSMNLRRGPTSWAVERFYEDTRGKDDLRAKRSRTFAQGARRSATDSRMAALSVQISGIRSMGFSLAMLNNARDHNR